MPSTIADGQLAASSGTILGVASAERCVNVVLSNTSGTNTETTYLTVSRGGGTARVLRRFVLSPYEQAELTNLPLDPSDVLAGYSTHATTVDYFITAAQGGPLSSRVLDSSGAPKSSASLATAGDLTVTGSFARAAGCPDYSGRNRVRVFEDFLPDAAATLPVPWGKQDTSSAGSPTTDFVADALNGEYKLAHDSQSEAQTLTLYWADQLVIDPTKNPVFEARLKINFAGAAFTADQRIVIGLASARNATLDSVVSNVWFRIEGANLNVLWETDDGSTDDDDNDSAIDIVDDTFTTFRIDLSDLADIKFYVDGVRCGGGTAAAVLTAANKLQPFIEIQRDAGTEQEAVHVDYVHVEWDRT